MKHLQALQRRGLAAAATSDPEVLPRFRQGFSDCAAEATRFLSRPPALPVPARTRLRQHLAACVAALQQPPPPLPHDLNGNIHVSGVPLIPSRLPTGELALVLPANTQLPFARPFPQQESHISAFQTVRSVNRPPSPASSVSSCDSMSSERGTPPHVSISNTFPTPPSQTSFNESSPETQRSIVSSTTISPESGPVELKPAERQRGSLWRQTDVQSPSKQSAIDYSMTPCRKKPYSTSTNLMSSVLTPEPPTKVRKIACEQVSSSQSPEELRRSQKPKEEQAGTSSSTSQPSGDMWRPW